MQIEDTKMMQYLAKKNNHFYTKIKEASRQAEIQLAHQVPKIFPEYTLHDIGHSLRVMDYMVDVIGDISRFSELEIAMLSMAALLHDVGMAISTDDINEIKLGKRNTDSLVYMAVLKRFSGNEKRALQEFIRRTHAENSSKIVKDSYSKYMTIPEMEICSYTNDVAVLCAAHTFDIPELAILEESGEKGRYQYNLRFCASILRIADLLDIDERRTPLTLYELVRPHNESDNEWRQHFVITNYEKIKSIGNTQRKQVDFCGSCKEPHIHRKLLEYFDWIEQELFQTIEAMNKMDEKYRLDFESKIKVNIRTEGYTFPDLKLVIDFKSITALLMGENLYGDRSVGLRELIQNAIDACNVRWEIESKKQKPGDTPYCPQISIIINASENKVVVKDNGIGMTENVMRRYFLNIGKSYYTSDEYAYRGLTYSPIGTYGIGFLACFMLSDLVRIKTHGLDSKYSLVAELEKGSEHISFTREEEYPYGIGTEVELNFEQFFEAIGLNEEALSSYIKSVFVFKNIQFDIVYTKKNLKQSLSVNLKSKIKLLPGQTVLDISKFLCGVEAYATLKKRPTYIRSPSDVISYSYLAVFVNSGEIVNLDKHVISLKDICNGQVLKFLEIPVYNTYDEDNFDIVEDLLDDVDETMNKFNEDDNIIVFASVEDQGCFHVGGTNNNLKFKIFSNTAHNTDKQFKFHTVYDVSISEILKKLEISGFCPKVTSKTMLVIASDDMKILLPYDQSTGNAWDFTDRSTLYIRNVLIKDYQRAVQMPFVTCFNQVNIYANIMTKQILPDVSRNRLDPQRSYVVSYALNRALHLAAAEQLGYTKEESNLIRSFVKRFYSKDNILVRK